MPMTPLLYLLCHPEAVVLQWQSPWSVTSSRLVIGVTFGGWNLMRVRLGLESISSTAWFLEEIIHGNIPWWTVFLARCFRGFVLPVLECCSAVWCSAADTHLNLLDRVVSGASFSTWVVFECDLAYCRAVAVSCMLYKILCVPMYPLYGALSVPYVPVQVTRGVVITHQYTHAPPRCRTSQYHITFIPLSVSLWNDLGDPVFNCVVLSSFKSKANFFYWPSCSLPFCLLLFSYLFSFCGLVFWGWGLRPDRVFSRSLPALHCQRFLNNNNYII